MRQAYDTYRAEREKTSLQADATDAAQDFFDDALRAFLASEDRQYRAIRVARESGCKLLVIDETYEEKVVFAVTEPVATLVQRLLPGLFPVYPRYMKDVHEGLFADCRFYLKRARALAAHDEDKDKNNAAKALPQRVARSELSRDIVRLCLEYRE